MQAWQNVSTNVSCCLRPFQLNGSGTVADFSQYSSAFFSLCSSSLSFPLLSFSSIVLFLFFFLFVLMFVFTLSSLFLFFFLVSERVSCSVSATRSTTYRLEKAAFFIGNNELSVLLGDKNDRPVRYCHVKTPFPSRSVCTKATSFWSGGIIVRGEFSIASLPISVQFVNSFWSFFYKKLIFRWFYR